MTLCGVLKDILLVAASILIWGTEISGLQAFGYGIALCGLVYYKLGALQMKAQFSDFQRIWAEYGVKHPVMRKLMVFCAVLAFMSVLLVGLAPTVGVDPKSVATAIKDSTHAAPKADTAT